MVIGSTVYPSDLLDTTQVETNPDSNIPVRYTNTTQKCPYWSYKIEDKAFIYTFLCSNVIMYPTPRWFNITRWFGMKNLPTTHYAH